MRHWTQSARTTIHKGQKPEYLPPGWKHHTQPTRNGMVRNVKNTNTVKPALVLSSLAISMISKWTDMSTGLQSSKQ